MVQPAQSFSKPSRRFSKIRYISSSDVEGQFSAEVRPRPSPCSHRGPNSLRTLARARKVCAAVHVELNARREPPYGRCGSVPNNPAKHTPAAEDASEGLSSTRSLERDWCGRQPV